MELWLMNVVLIVAATSQRDAGRVAFRKS